MSAELVINISNRGEVDIEANGFEGTACTEATDKIKVALNGTTSKDEKKPEFYSQTSTSTHKLTF